MLGLTLPGPAQTASALITPALILMMSFSMTAMKFSEDSSASQSDSSVAWMRLLKTALPGLFINYGLLSGLILTLSFCLSDESLYKGFVVMAAVPPAVAVLPMTRILQGETVLSFTSEALSYLASIILMPAIIFAFTSHTGISLAYISEITLAFILLPAIASRAAARIPIDPVLPINLGFFAVTYIVIGLNHAALWQGTLIVAAISLARTFVIGLIIYGVALRAGLDRSKTISYTLLGSFKNLGLAAAISLLLFGPAAGIPAAFSAIAEIGFFILLTIIKPR